MKTGHVIQIAQELSGRWTIPILLSLKETGGRFTPLQHRLDISPSRLSDNLKKLESKGIIQHLSPFERRHPLLPEYQLTEKGLFLQEAARAIQLAEDELSHGFLAEKSWTWPLLIALNNGCSRFQSIRQMLQPATPRILSMRIDDLYDKGLINKLLAEKPRPGYRYMLEKFARPPVNKVEADLCSLL